MNFEEKLRNLFEKNLDKKPMSIKDDRVIGVQEILRQRAEAELKTLPPKTEKEYWQDWDNATREEERLRYNGMPSYHPKIIDLNTEGLTALHIAIDERDNNQDYRKDIKQLGRFMLAQRPNFSKNPMSIKDGRVPKVQEILKQRAEIELNASLKDSAKNYSAEKNSATIESTEQRITTLLKAGMDVDTPEIQKLHQESKRAHAAESKEETARVYRQDLKEQGRFLQDPLTPEEKQAKQAKQAKQLRNLFEKIFAKKPMSIKDDRVIGVQEILRQKAEAELKTLPPKTEKEYRQDCANSCKESTRLLYSGGMPRNHPRITDLNTELSTALDNAIDERENYQDYRKEIKQLGRFMLAQSPNFSKNPMSIKDDRVKGVQKILKQRAEAELNASLKDSAENYSAEKNSATIESTEQRIKILLEIGMDVDFPEIQKLHQESKRAHAAESREETARVYRQDIKQLGRFLQDPLTPEEKEAKQAKLATKKAPKKKSKGMKM